MAKRILTAIAFSFIPSLLLFSGKTDYVFNWCITHQVVFTSQANLASYKFWSFLIGIIVTGVWLPIQLATINASLDKTRNKFHEFVTYNKQLQIDTLCIDIKAHKHPFNTRIFVPKINFISRFRKKKYKKYNLHLTDVKGVSDNHHAKNLTFKVDKETTEGVVGKSFKERAVVIDFDLTDNNTYQLTDVQKLKVGDVTFCSAIPIFDKKNNIKAVVCVDSTENIKRTEERTKHFEKFLMYFAAFIDKNNLLN